jgi:hypothetical protein
VILTVIHAQRLNCLSQMNSLCFIDKFLVFSTNLVEVLLKNYWNDLTFFSDFLWLTELAYVPDIPPLMWTQPKSSGKGYKRVHSLDKVEAMTTKTGQ